MRLLQGSSCIEYEDVSRDVDIAELGNEESLDRMVFVGRWIIRRVVEVGQDEILALIIKWEDSAIRASDWTAACSFGKVGVGQPGA